MENKIRKIKRKDYVCFTINGSKEEFEKFNELGKLLKFKIYYQTEKDWWPTMVTYGIIKGHHYLYDTFERNIEVFRCPPQYEVFVNKRVSLKYLLEPNTFKEIFINHHREFLDPLFNKK